MKILTQIINIFLPEQAKGAYDIYVSFYPCLTTHKYVNNIFNIFRDGVDIYY